VAAISVSPQRRRLGMFFQIHSHNVRGEDVAGFLREIHRHLGRCILVLDRYSVHRKAVRLLGAAHPKWFDLEWLPAYAPELNPVEQIWNHSKYSDLANFIPDDVYHLRHELVYSLCDQRANPGLLRSFFNHAELSL
jgi:transposase